MQNPPHAVSGTDGSAPAQGAGTSISARAMGGLRPDAAAYLAVGLGPPDG